MENGVVFTSKFEPSANLFFYGKDPKNYNMPPRISPESLAAHEWPAFCAAWFCTYRRYITYASGQARATNVQRHPVLARWTSFKEVGLAIVEF